MCVVDLQTLSGLLNLDGFEVVEAVSEEGKKVYRLVVVPTSTVGLCPHCGRATGERHACHDREIVDLPLGGWRTELTVRMWQFRCGPCGKFFTPHHAALAEGAHATERFLQRLAEWATHADVSAAARFLGVAEKTAERWYYDYLRRLERRRKEAGAKGAGGKPGDKGLLPIRSLGIDELSLKKGTASSSVC